MKSSGKPYRWLAQYYDEFFQPLRAPIDAARNRLLRTILPRVQTACDLACGAGTTAIALAQRGIKVYALDLSPEMCRIARRKTVGLPVMVCRADMRKFQLPEPVDLILCECDALNHIPRKSDLRAVAKSVAAASKSGGHFFFDVNNSLAFERYWSGTFWAEKPGIVMAMNNAHNRKAERAWSDIDWFVQDESGKAWRRYRERVEEVCWTAEEIQRVFAAAGFAEQTAWDAAPFFKKTDPRVTPGCRTIYLMRKG